MNIEYPDVENTQRKVNLDVGVGRTRVLSNCGTWMGAVIGRYRKHCEDTGRLHRRGFLRTDS